MASDIGPQFPSTPNCLWLWSKLNHLSSHSLQVLAGLSKDRSPGLHRSTGTRGYRAIAAAATLIEKNLRIATLKTAAASGAASAPDCFACESVFLRKFLGARFFLLAPRPRSGERTEERGILTQRPASPQRSDFIHQRKGNDAA